MQEVDMISFIRKVIDLTPHIPQMTFQRPKIIVMIVGVLSVPLNPAQVRETTSHYLSDVVDKHLILEARVVEGE